MAEEPDLFDEARNQTALEKTRAFLRSGSDLHVHLSLEKFIVTVAVATVLMVAVFVAGFMRGKAVRDAWEKTPVERLETRAAAPSAYAVTPQTIPTADLGREFVPQPSKTKEFAKRKSKPYTIQVVTYRSQARAFKEVEALRKKGYETRIIRRGKYFQVCVGQYANRREAGPELKALGKKYKDRYLRNLPS